MRHNIATFLRSALFIVCALAAFAETARAEGSGLLSALDDELSFLSEADPTFDDADDPDLYVGAPSWAIQNALNGVWRELADWRRDRQERNAFSYFDALEAERQAEEYEQDRDLESLDDNSRRIFRGQIEPPVVSPTTATNNYGKYTYAYDNINVEPPATMEDVKNDPTTINRMFKYQQDCSKSFVYIPRTSGGLGIIEGGARIFFAIPCETFQNNRINGGVFMLTPNFDFTNIQVPKNQDLGYKFPKNLFDLGLTTGFRMSVNDFEGGVEVQVGVASEFKKLSGDAIYVRGRAEGSLPVDNDRRVRVVGGVGYYDRLKYKLLPVAGAIWTPNSKNEFRLVFPDPMWGHFLTKVNETDWWFYVRGDIGGNRWLMSDPNHKVRGKTTYNFDYDDYRVGAGVRFDCPKGWRGSFEVGGAFAREIRTKAGTVYKPKSSVYLQANLFL